MKVLKYKEIKMPKVNGKKFPYTAKGKAAAKKEAAKKTSKMAKAKAAKRKKTSRSSADIKRK